MPEPLEIWQIQPTVDLPEWFLQAVQQHTALPGHYAAQLLWQRGIRDRQSLAGFLNPNHYQPTSPFAFGQEMEWAIARLQTAYQQGERLAIWGDFDADGVTATAVLWEGLGQFFPPDQQLTYFIPNRLTDSHGLSIHGLETLAQEGCQLIITCDTGSTNAREIEYAYQLGMEVIVTDHHTLPGDRPGVVALINPRSLPANHPLATLSGVAVAYKLIEALYQTLPQVPQQPLETLLDLVAIGLIADLVELKGDGRYLAQRGIDQLQQQQHLETASRPGIASLLELCKRSGDRPTDISFGLGPRINAISRIYGDARFAVELLTSRDRDRCRHLAESTELANTRRKSLQKDVAQQVRTRLTELDLSTIRVIVLSDPQWSVGVLGLVAGQIAQDYGRPTILLSTDIGSSSNDPSSTPPLARGSARSVHQIDLYQLVKDQAHLLHRFGGHPYAAGLSLPIENISVFTEAVNRQLRTQYPEIATLDMVADLRVTVAELGKDLFRELKLLEPYGMGNPTPKLLIQQCWFEHDRNQNIKDWKGRKIRYIKTEFDLRDDSSDTGFPGIWWEHYRDDLPAGRCDAIAELDFNTYHKRYEIRLLQVRPTTATPSIAPSPIDWLLDRRTSNSLTPTEIPQDTLRMTDCPDSWDELRFWIRRAVREQRPLAIAYPPPPNRSPGETWQHLVGLAKYLSRTGKIATRSQLLNKLGVGDRPLDVGVHALKAMGFQITASEQGLSFCWDPPETSDPDHERNQLVEPFLSALREEQFRRQYFYTVPLPILQAIARESATPQAE